MTNKTKPWDEQRIIAEAEALAAHFKKHDLDHYEMSRLIVRDMRQVKDHFGQRIAELEAEVTKWRELAEGTASLWMEARDELAKLRAEQWQPVEDGKVNEYETDIDGVTLSLKINGSVLTITEHQEPDYEPGVEFYMNFTLPDNIRLCKRGES